VTVASSNSSTPQYKITYCKPRHASANCVPKPSVVTVAMLPLLALHRVEQVSARVTRQIEHDLTRDGNDRAKAVKSHEDSTGTPKF
jgi:hypothetical protein